jgi:zinc protease
MPGSETKLARVLALPRPGAPPRPRVPSPVRWEMENGLRVVAIPSRGVPQVAVRVVLPAGAAADPAGHPGTAGLVGALLTEGTARLDAATLNARLDLLGAAIHTQVGHDFTDVNLSCLSETLDPALELLAAVLTEPAFPTEELERVREETLDALDARLDEPANVADDSAAEALFGPEHPYARLAMGSPEGVAMVPRDRLAAFHRAYYAPTGCVLVIAGDFDLQELRLLLERHLGGWAGVAGRTHYPSPPVAPALARERVALEWPDAAQGEVRVVGLGLPRAHPDWIPAAVANYILGGSTITGRLGANLREDRGWTYGVRSGFAGALHPGGWAVETAVDVKVAYRAVEEIHGELERFRSERVPEDELERAREALTLSLPRAFETAGRIVSRFATLEAFGLPEAYWEEFVPRVHAVTSDEVMEMAHRYFHADALVSVVVGIPAAEPTAS